MPNLTVLRDNGWTDKIRNYRILVDGIEIGSLGEGAKLKHPISEGPHVIEAKIDWCGSHPLEFSTTTEDQTVVVKSGLRGWRVFLSIYYITFGRRNYITLELLS
ncbi:hypothetical protein JYT83_00860 [bacterium AH-315-F18]|nr:hypothetical protein [bacterium AH-315-F18]